MSTFQEWLPADDNEPHQPTDYVTWLGPEPDNDPYTVDVTPVTLSLSSDSGAPDSDTVTGVTGTARACHALDGIRTGHWLESQTFPDVEYVVPNLIPEGFTLLVGAPKAGKSWLVLAVSLSVAAGGKVLDQSVTTRPVLHLALEDSDRRLRYRAKTLYPAGELPPDWHYLVRIPQGYTAPDVVEAWLERLPADTSSPLIVVDTLGKVRPGKRPGEGVYDYDYRIGGRIKLLADSVPGSGLVAVHHDRKAGAADFVDDVSGSNGLAGAADTIAIVRRDRNTADGVFLVTGRDVTEGAYAATFEAGHWALVGGGWDSAAAAYAQTAAIVGKGDTTQRIVRWLTEHQPATPKQVADTLGIAHDVARQTLSRLAKDGRLDRADGAYFLPNVGQQIHPWNGGDE